MLDACGVEAQVFLGTRDVHMRREGKGLSIVASLRLGELIRVVADCICEPIEARRTFRGRGRRPCGKGALGSCHGPIDFSFA